MNYVLPIVAIAVLWWQSLKVAYAKGRRDQTSKLLQDWREADSRKKLAEGLR